MNLQIPARLEGLAKALGRDVQFAREMCLHAPSLLNRRPALIRDRWQLYQNYAEFNPIWQKQLDSFGPHTAVKLLKVRRCRRQALFTGCAGLAPHCNAGFLNFMCRI